MDSNTDIDGPALETLFLQEARALNDYYDLGYTFYYWRTRSQAEVDFVLYGEKGLHAFEIKRKTNLTSKDFKGLKTFGDDYPMAKLYLFYGGQETYHENNIQVIPFSTGLTHLLTII